MIEHTYDMTRTFTPLSEWVGPWFISWQMFTGFYLLGTPHPWWPKNRDSDTLRPLDTAYRPSLPNG